jgi:hypothetical protein
MLETYLAINNYLGWKDIGHILIDHVEEKGQITGHEKLLEAELLGRSMADLSEKNGK